MIVDVQVRLDVTQLSNEEIDILKAHVRERGEAFANAEIERIMRKRKKDEERKARITLGTQFEVDDEGNTITTEKTPNQVAKSKYNVNYYKQKVRETKVKCIPCNASYSKYNINNHYRSVKHAKNVELTNLGK